MHAMVSDERVQDLANECIAMSRRIEDQQTASDLMKLSQRILQLTNPTLPTWKELRPKVPVAIRGFVTDLLVERFPRRR
jgi:hypothetical protein